MAFYRADDDTLIYFEVRGDSPGREWMLLLPGLLGSTTSQWQNFAEPLAQEYRIILVDLRGHGRSETRDLSLAPDRMIQDLQGLLNQLEVERLHVAGYDLGGYLGLMLHLTEPQRVATLLMHATKYYWTSEAANDVRQQLDPDKLGDNVPVYAGQLATEHGASRWRVLVREAADLVAYLAQNRIPESTVARTQCPVLVSVGDRDELVSVQEAQRLSRLMTRGALLVLPEVRHPFRTTGVVPLLPALRAFHQSANRRRR